MKVQTTERYVVEVGTRTFKYLGYYYDRFDLKSDMVNAEFFNSESDAQEYIDTVKLLQGKKCRIRKIEIKFVD